MKLFDILASAFGFGKREARVVVVGLDNSGKTTLIQHVKPPKTVSRDITPTVGFQVEEFSKDRLHFTVYDMSGQSRYRDLWEHYYADVQAIIFVIDSTDRLRICVVKDELRQLLEHPEIARSKAPILFFANKMDLPSAMTAEEVSEELGLSDIRDKSWQILSSDARVGTGVEDGINWLCRSITSRHK